MNCKAVFEKEEWQAIWLMSGDTELPKEPPPLQKVIIKLAMSGGYLNRKHDIPPGVKVLWIGMQQLQSFIEGFNVAKKLFGIS